MLLVIIMTPRGLLLVTLSLILADSSYVPGTPGAPWTRDEVLAVKAKLTYRSGQITWHTITNTGRAVCPVI